MTDPKKSFKELLDSKVKEISRGARNSPDRKPIPWFQRGEVMALLSKALQHKADEVHLDGKRFNIAYHEGNRAFVSPTDGSFVPCAHLYIDKYIEDWEIEKRAHTVTRLG